MGSPYVKALDELIEDGMVAVDTYIDLAGRDYNLNEVADLAYLSVILADYLGQTSYEDLLDGEKD